MIKPTIENLFESLAKIAQFCRMKNKYSCADRPRDAATRKIDPCCMPSEITKQQALWAIF